MIRKYHHNRRSLLAGAILPVMLLAIVSHVTASNAFSSVETEVAIMAQDITLTPTSGSSLSNFQQTQTAEVQPTDPAPTITVTPIPADPPPDLRDETMLQDTSLISGEPCAAPCFHGITPGETSWNDALGILEDVPDFQDIFTQVSEWGYPRVVAWWAQNGSKDSCCQLVTDDGEMVDLLFVRTAPTMTLGEVIEAHGDPIYLDFNGFTDDQAVASLVYPDVPMVVHVFVQGTEAGQLRAESEIIGMLYLLQRNMDLLLQVTDLHAWEGYQPVKDYVEGEFEVTPSITLTPMPGN